MGSWYMDEYMKPKKAYLQKAIALHRDQWHWVAKQTKLQNRKVRPEEYIEARDIKDINGSPLKNRKMIACACCEQMGASRYGHCHEGCPIVWDGPSNPSATCQDTNSSYQLWERATDLNECIRLAEKIAELPEARNRVRLFDFF